jgi:hypothetical protein
MDDARVWDQVEGGSFRLQGDIPSSFDLMVSDQREGPQGTANHGEEYVQILHVDSWIPEERKDLKLAPWCDLEVRVTGIPEEYRLCTFEVSLYTDTTPSVSVHAVKYLGFSGDGARRFRIRTGAGRYRLAFDGLFPRPDVHLDIRESESLQILEVQV